MWIWNLCGCEASCWLTSLQVVSKQHKRQDWAESWFTNHWQSRFFSWDRWCNSWSNITVHKILRWNDWKKTSHTPEIINFLSTEDAALMDQRSHLHVTSLRHEQALPTRAVGEQLTCWGSNRMLYWCSWKRWGKKSPWYNIRYRPRKCWRWI